MIKENTDAFSVAVDAEPVLAVFQSVQDKKEREKLVMMASAYLDGYIAGQAFDKQLERKER